MKIMNAQLNMNKIEDYLKSIDVPIVGHTEPFEDFALTEVLQRHAAQGHYIYFGDTSIEQRQQIEAVFPVCESIIVIGIPYNSRNKSKEHVQDSNGFVSNMAWEYDYHTLVRQKLELLQGFLGSCDETVESLIQVDTGPLIDRHIAFKAGLGSYGKNQCLMHATYGTEFYIGYLMINKKIELASKAPLSLHETRCKTCNKCVKACPGNVLTNQFEFQGQRCISYLTQKKTHLTWAERVLLGDSVYGCDICQLVCPENRGKEIIPLAYERKTLNQIELKGFISKSNKQLMRDYKSSGFSWRGAKVLKRNALIALGNQNANGNCDFLESLLEGVNDYLLPYVLWALYKSGYNQMEIICKKFFEENQDEIVKKECQSILAIL